MVETTTPTAASRGPEQPDRQRENEMLAASAYPVAVAAQAVAEAKSATDKVRTAAGQLLAAGVSLRTPAPGEAMLEYASGTAESTTIRWRRTPDGERLAVNNPGRPYKAPDPPPPATDYIRTPPTATPTTARVHELMRTVSRNPAWRMTGFTNTRLRAQRRTAERLDKLHRQLSLWIRSWEADAPFPGRRARRRLTTLAMIRLDCGARTTAERNNAGEVTSLTIMTGPDPDIAIDCGHDATIITPAAHRGIAAVWTARPAGAVRPKRPPVERLEDTGGMEPAPPGARGSRRNRTADLGRATAANRDAPVLEGAEAARRQKRRRPLLGALGRRGRITANRAPEDQPRRTRRKSVSDPQHRSGCRQTHRGTR